MKFNHRLRALALVALAALVCVGIAVAATNRAAVKPSNQTVPAINGDASVGSTLTADPGTWNGSTPLSFQYQWQVCGQNGNSCHAISGATANTYVVKSGDQGNTLRVKVIAGNSDGSDTATSGPTGTVKATATPTPTPTPTPAPVTTGCPKTTASDQAVAVTDVASPARLQITSFVPSLRPITHSVSNLSVRLHVGDTCGQPVSGAQVYATAVPFGQFTIPGLGTTDANGNVTLTFSRKAGFPAAAHQQLLVMFVRASKPGDSILAGITTNRLISLQVRLNG